MIYGLGGVDSDTQGRILPTRSWARPVWYGTRRGVPNRPLKAQARCFPAPLTDESSRCNSGPRPSFDSAGEPTK